MKRVLKYVLEPEGGIVQVVKMPITAKFLHLDAQDKKVALWHEVIEAEPPAVDSRTVYNSFLCVLTGEQIPKTERWQYVGTALFDEGRFVVHVYRL